MDSYKNVHTGVVATPQTNFAANFEALQFQNQSPKSLVVNIFHIFHHPAVNG
jgi:hypothetical protein